MGDLTKLKNSSNIYTHATGCPGITGNSTATGCTDNNKYIVSCVVFKVNFISFVEKGIS